MKPSILQFTLPCVIFILVITSVIGIQVFENVNEDETTSSLPTPTNSSESPMATTSPPTTTIPNAPSAESSTKAATTPAPVITESPNMLMSFEGNVNSKMPVQYPKPSTTSLDPRHNSNEIAQFNSMISPAQQYSNYKKRQLSESFKMQQQNNTKSEQQLSTPTDDNNNHQDDKNNHQPSSTNSLSNTKDFIPSPQYGSFSIPKSVAHFEHHHHPPHHESHDNHNNNNNFQPISYEAYTTQSPYSQHHHAPPKWNVPQQQQHVDTTIYQHHNFEAPQQIADLPKHYPKFDEYAKELQNDNNKTPWFPPSASKEKGKFVWLPEGEAAQYYKPKEYELKPEIKNGTGKWKWMSDDEYDPESKIISHGPSHPTYYEQIKIYQEPKPNYDPTKEHPYSFDFGTETPSVFSVDVPGHSGHGFSGELPETTTVEPQKGGGGLSLMDMLFRAWNQNGISDFGAAKGKEKDKELETSGRNKKGSPWAKVLQFLTAAVPIGIIISSLTPQYVYVNPNTTVQTPPLNPPVLSSIKQVLTGQSGTVQRQQSMFRSLEQSTEDEEGRKMSNPLMDFLTLLSGQNDDTVERNGMCEDRVFCEMAVIGARDDAEVLNKMLWRIANETPEDRARHSGLSEIFRVIRDNRCFVYECENWMGGGSTAKHEEE